MRRAAQASPREIELALRPQVAAFAERLQFDPAHVRAICLDWERLREAGVLLQVRIYGTSQLWRTPEWEELGIHKDDVAAQTFTLGAAALFGKERVNKVESMEARYRQWLDRLSYDVMGFRPYRLVLIGDGDPEHPERSAYWTLRRKYAELDLEWAARVEDLLGDAAYAEARAEMEVRYGKIADEAYPKIINRIRRFYAEQPSVREAALRTLGTLEQFRARVQRRALDRFPTQAEARRKLRVELEAGYHLDPAGLERVLLERDRLREERDAVHHEHLNQYVVRLLDQPRPFDSVLSEVPGQLFRQAKSAIATIQAQGFLPGQTKTALKRMKAHYLLMSLGRDATLERRLDELEAALALPGRVEQLPDGRTRELSSDIPAVLQALRALMDATRAAVELLSELRPEVWGGMLQETPLEGMVEGQAQEDGHAAQG